MICQDCKFYNSTRNGICGLGLDCSDAITESSCDFKVVGQPILVKLEEGNKWDYEPGNSLPQAPNIEGLIYYHRKHTQVNSTTRIVELIIVVSFNRIVEARKQVCFMFSNAKITTKSCTNFSHVMLISWIESKRKAFKTKLTKKHRLHTI
jgi:hypothetical protein